MAKHSPLLTGTVVAALAAALSTFASAQAPRMPPPMPMPMPVPGINMPSAPAAAGTAVVSGRVVAAIGGNGIRRAQVRLMSTEGRGSFSVQADEQGAFVFHGVPAGQFMLSATKLGYLEAKHGQRRPGSGSGAPISVAAGATIERLSLPMARGSVITGTIVDEAGEPAFGTHVRAMRMTLQNGERVPVQAGTATVDDRGSYRIPVLTPGDYILVATAPAEPDALRAAFVAMPPMMSAGGDFFTMAPPPPPPPPPPSRSSVSGPAESTGYAPVYFPGTSSSGAAQPVTLGLGEERGGVDLQMTMVRLGRVTGTVMGDAGPAAMVPVQLVDASQALPGLSTRNAMTGPDGAFTFQGVPPGQYTVTARSGMSGAMRTSFSTGPGGQQVMEVVREMRLPVVTPSDATAPAPPQWASAEVTVAGNATATAALTLRPGMTVSGRLAFDGAGAPSDFTNIQVRLNLARAGQFGGSAVTTSTAARVSADGQFRVEGVTPGEYALAVSGVGPWRLHSVEAAGREALDSSLDVKPGEDISGVVATLTTRTTSLTGTFEDAAGKPTSDHTVIIAAADRRYWTPRSRRIRATRPSTDGKFSFEGLPAGDYRLFAVDDVEDGEWFDPAFLEKFVGASIAVTLAEDGKQVQNIRIR